MNKDKNILIYEFYIIVIQGMEIPKSALKFS